MELAITKRYLKIPVRHAADKRRFSFSENGVTVYGFDACYDAENPDVIYCADLVNYLGRTLEIVTDFPFEAQLCDELPPLPPAQTVLRPAVHFTAERGWINDPNGLVRINGRYHLFFQHNPYGRLWGNMHWGHAVSDDLFHWQQLDEALFSESAGTMFSGCGVIDAAGNPVFFYTCSGEVHTQNMAYSIDGGMTLTKYAKNPLIPQVVPGNRDPKVIYDAERRRWLMALFYNRDMYFAIYTSQNLLDWTELQRVELPDYECPDLYPLTADDGKTLWIFSGAGDKYLAGAFDENGLYQPIQSAGQLSYDSKSYAAQTYFYEQGRPVIRMSWNRSEVPGAPFNCSMCTPAEMSLRSYDGRYYLCAEPINTDPITVKKTELCDVTDASIPIASRACRVDIVADVEFDCDLYGLKIAAKRDGVRAGDAFLPRVFDEPMRLTLISDTVSTELYLNGAAICALEHIQGCPAFSLHADGKITSLHLKELSLQR